MGAEKGGSKSGGFFHLFDWNRKSRKKLFSNVSPEGTKQGKRSEDNLPTTRFCLVDEGDNIAVSSIKGSSDYSCASSVTDEDGNGTKVPGVVARLMGLDSMPVSNVSEPYSTPFFDRRLLRDSHSLKRSPEFSKNDPFNHLIKRGEGYIRKPVESRAQKMPSSPIERFQTEILPPRSAKSLPITHHKLLSPIKNHGFSSAKNAAQIMEAAAKILEPRLQASSAKGKASSFGSCSVPLKVCDPKESMIASQRTSRLLQLSKAPVDTTDVRFSRGQPLNRTWNSPEDIVIFRPSPDPYEINVGNAKGKGKSINLAVQAKVNVQRREGLSLSTPGTNRGIQKEHEECRLNQLSRNQPNIQKNKQQKKQLAGNASGVLRQNNQKQNCPPNRNKLGANKSVASQQGRKVSSLEASSGKHRNVNKVSVNSRVGYRKDVVETTVPEREGSSSINKDFPQKKRLIAKSFSGEKSTFVENSFSRNEKRIQPNVMIDEYTKWNRDDGHSTDVVSFTFTSPLIKPSTGSRLSSNVEQNAIDTKGKSLSSMGFDVINGDALSLLLEQKLKELSSVAESSHNFSKAGSFSPFGSSSREPQFSSSDFVKTEQGKFEFGPSKEKNSIFDYCLSSANSQVFGMSHNLQGDCNSSCDARKEQDDHHLSPLSILDTTFSVESCLSLESSGSSDGMKKCSSSVQAQNITCSSKASSTEAELDLSDSASSAFQDTSDIPDTLTSSEIKTTKFELQYIKEILSNTELGSDDLGSLFMRLNAGETLDPLLFDKLESKRSRITNGKEIMDSKANRKLWFDCVIECLESTHGIYFEAGYKAWSKGIVATKKGLEREIFGEIMEWKSMGDWMVDDLVDRDMSTRLGKWVDFQKEAFETGVDIEGEILGSLVDEILGDICIKVQH
ncbi:uncharacterized protein LOC109723918 [Ananas comosus]|uniref:Uncharacterized protein LOC109723918 n=1 Tax=Ananas comosus TaxID=4615 RepID=A0A6P5GPS2_ANACO|nr:uncharacterized protein LOC109723918 [Ananas comosus]